MDARFSGVTTPITSQIGRFSRAHVAKGNCDLARDAHPPVFAAEDVSQINFLRVGQVQEAGVPHERIVSPVDHGPPAVAVSLLVLDVPRKVTRHFVSGPADAASDKSHHGRVQM